MGRGYPAVWSTILGLPFIVTGLYLYLSGGSYPAELGVPPFLFGVFIVGTGLYVHYVAAPASPELREDEEFIARRHPTQRVAAIKIGLGLPILALTGYLLVFTVLPYVYPTITLLIGLYLFSNGLYVYWTNTLTNYYVTNQRIIKEYRFLSLLRQELPLDKVRGVQERKTVTESLVGLGNVRVASGGGHSLEIKMRNMPQASDFAESVRNVM